MYPKKVLHLPIKEIVKNLEMCGDSLQVHVLVFCECERLIDEIVHYKIR